MTWPALDDHELKIIHQLVGWFLKDFDVFQTRKEEIIDICVDHWQQKKSQYNPDRGTREGFMKSVIRNKLKDLIRVWSSRKNFHQYFKESLNQLLDEKSESQISLSLVVNNHPIDSLARDELKIRLEFISKQLNPQQQIICQMLSERKNITEISRYLNKDRKTIYKDIERIRLMFVEDGLNDYL